MRNNKKLSAIAACVLAGAMLLAGCSKKEDDSVSGSSDISDNSSDMSSIGTGIGVDPPDAGTDDSSRDPLEYTSGEIYAKVGGVADAAMRDEQVYANGEGFQYKFASSLIITEDGGDAPNISEMEPAIDKFLIGDKEYAYGDIVRDKTQGIEVLKLFAKDFGLNICDDTGMLKSREGDVQDIDKLRESYSDRVEYDDYTACTYYFDARMNALDAETYDKYRDKYEKKNGVDAGATLDGILAVILYYDTSGHDYFYSIVLSAPTYYSDEKNFDANMNTNVRKDITNCAVRLKDGTRVGFVNKTAIMCSAMPGGSPDSSGAES